MNILQNSIKDTIHVHLALPKWRQSSYYKNDIAVIELDEPFKNVTPICLRKMNDKGLKELVQNKDKFIVAGKLILISF